MRSWELRAGEPLQKLFRTPGRSPSLLLLLLVVRNAHTFRVGLRKITKLQDALLERKGTTLPFLSKPRLFVGIMAVWEHSTALLHLMLLTFALWHVMKNSDKLKCGMTGCHFPSQLVP